MSQAASVNPDEKSMASRRPVKVVGAAVEYTSEIQRLGSSHKVGTPEDWKWPPKRNDHWGISTRNSAAISQAERRFGFRPLVAA